MKLSNNLGKAWAVNSLPLLYNYGMSLKKNRGFCQGYFRGNDHISLPNTRLSRWFSDLPKVRDDIYIYIWYISFLQGRFPFNSLWPGQHRFGGSHFGGLKFRDENPRWCDHDPCVVTVEFFPAKNAEKCTKCLICWFRAHIKKMVVKKNSVQSEIPKIFIKMSRGNMIKTCPARV